MDRAWDARERSRARLAQAGGASAGGKTAVAVARAAQDAAARLGGPDDPVALGRVDHVDGQRLYIGKHAVSDDDQNLLVIGWKATAAAPYFTATVDAGRTGEMHDIVATIHAAQYELVRAPLDQLLVVPGGPGTGKTVVALHRVSWLLYQHRGTLRPDDVLVVGPNPTFTRYIRAVLPDRGDADVVHQDLRSLGPVVSSGRSEDDDVARIKGDARMVGLVTRAMAQRVRLPERTERLEIPVGERSPAVLDRSEVERELRNGLGSARSYTAGRTAMRTWPSLSAAAFLRDLLSSRERLLAAAGDDFTAAEVQLLVRTASDRVSDESWTDADIPLLDEAEELLTGQARTYSHVVLDEAQDLSPMQLRSVRRRCPGGSMTVVGDLAQSTGLWARDDWEGVVSGLQGQHPAVIEELCLGYRVPQQVFDLAARLLPQIAPSFAAPTVVRRGPADPDLRRVDADDVAVVAVQAAREHAGRGLFVGIVCAQAHHADVTAELRTSGVSFTDTRGGSLGSSINLVAPAEAKGLEFDAVVVVEPEAITGADERGLRLLYVALTRTTKYLTVVHSGTVLPLPGADDDRWPLPAGSPIDPSVDRDHPPVLAQTAVTGSTHAGDALTRAVAVELARQVRAVVQPGSFPAVLAELRTELEQEES